METIDKSFALVTQALLKQKQYLEELERENQELHQQLADLRAGNGISIDILGQRFLLAVTAPDSEAILEATLQTPVVTHQAPNVPMFEVPETPAPGKNLSDMDRTTEELSPSPSPAFLQEMIFDEFATAATSPMAVWHSPTTKPPANDEEEKAALRRELMGSFLLE